MTDDKFFAQIPKRDSEFFFVLHFLVIRPNKHLSMLKM